MHFERFFSVLLFLSFTIVYFLQFEDISTNPKQLENPDCKFSAQQVSVECMELLVRWMNMHVGRFFCCRTEISKIVLWFEGTSDPVVQKVQNYKITIIKNLLLHLNVKFENCRMISHRSKYGLNSLMPRSDSLAKYFYAQYRAIKIVNFTSWIRSWHFIPPLRDVAGNFWWGGGGTDQKSEAK